MSSSIARSVRKIKEDLGSIVAADQIVRLCQATGHTWRDRTLGPVNSAIANIARIVVFVMSSSERGPRRIDSTRHRHLRHY